MTEALKFFDPPPVRYFGSKWQLADWIIAQMPPHDIYIEPFCGGASVLLRKERSTVEVLNDLNGDVIHFFDTLRARSEELIRAIELTPYSRAEYERSFEPTDDPIDRARRFYVRCWMAFGNGGIERKTGWRHIMTDNRGSTPAGDFARLDGLMKAARRLRGVQIENKHALWVLEHYDTPQTLFYVDPPYVLKSRQRATGRYVHEMDDLQHRQLADALHRIQGMVLLSGYKSDLYDELYAGWHVSSKTNTTNGNSTSVEYLWSNPQATDLSKLPLFEVR